MGKQITPITSWSNGSIKTAEILDMYIIHDDLKSSCNFYYSLKSSNGEDIITQGNLLMDGADYENWIGSSDDAYIWASFQLNLTLI